MDNVFNKAAGAGSNRKLHSKKGSQFSPSYGVRRGFIKDPNWPPAQFPEEGNASQRRFRRIPCSFAVRVDEGTPIQVTGNLSTGGAMFTMPLVLNTHQIEIELGGSRAAAEVIAAEAKGGKYIYRARFLDVSEVVPLWIAAMKNN